MACSGHDDLVSGLNKCRTRCISETVNETVHLIEPTGKETTRNHPFTAKWVLQRVQEDPVERARVHLQVWVPKREREYSDSFIKEL